MKARPRPASAPAKAKAKTKPSSRPRDPAPWKFRLYVAGQTPRSLAAFANLRRLCDELLAGRYEIEVIDLMKFPERGREDQIIALPTLVRQMPTPIKRLIGDLSDKQRVLLGIELIPPPSLP
jgi:circadian clock protein KaiB